MSTNLHWNTLQRQVDSLFFTFDAIMFKAMVGLPGWWGGGGTREVAYGGGE